MRALRVREAEKKKHREVSLAVLLRTKVINERWPKMYYLDDILGMLSMSQNNCLKINDLNRGDYRSHNFFKGLFEK